MSAASLSLTANSSNPAPAAEPTSPARTTENHMTSAAPATIAASKPAPKNYAEPIGRALRALLPPILGFALLVGIWAIVSMKNKGIPTPEVVWHAAVTLFSDPFYSNGPNDQGIGWNILSSLKRVAIGFGFAAAVGIPLGFMIGRFKFLSAALDPIISLLRPVSPLAWLPIGLLVFKKADPAATWTIFICSIWPMILNTAQGVQRVPQDYLNVARVLNLSEWKVITKILFPSVLPYMLTGIRLSIGTAWLVIVAAEMLTGGVGIGFWVWDEWNNLKVEHIIIAIFVIGLVGLLLEQLLIQIAKKFSYDSNS
ncbi:MULTISPECIES: nitrate ABC transporter permease [unclassified Uliginosibacterium]|uniref:nitrate ABC transporter permease n=1 Tax=unclassified Uliginosibacterium TaxID=2621521 RepID=UPI000C7967F5|nr:MULTISPECIES: nitrate ABC transporter permease [unclassified Uliginosibacterium]MDO6385731.1 nitrate ABC transporter permease [Uliginosibacterium sp. 31-12]PLK49754.1 nitrate ABC transporter, permease protein [Uliginosibacterium sp. TH139]